MRRSRCVPAKQTTAAISPGSSGGGLFNANAELIGITTFQVRDGQTLNFAVPIEWLSELAGRSDQRKRKWQAAGGEELETRAVVAWFKGDWVSLLRSASKLAEVDPYHSQYWIYLGSAYAHHNKSDKAAEAFARAVTLDPSADIWREMADGYFIMGFSFVDGTVRTDKKMLASARKAIEQALRLAPEDALSWSLSGQINQRLGNLDQAIRDLNEALRIRPKDSGSWVTLMEIYQDQGDRGKAAYAARRAMAANHGSWQLRMVVMAVADGIGDDMLLREAYVGLKQLNPEMARRYEANRRQ